MGMEALAKFLMKSGKKAGSLLGHTAEAAHGLAVEHPHAASGLAGLGLGGIGGAYAASDHDEPDADDYGGESDGDEDDMRREKLKHLLRSLED